MTVLDGFFDAEQEYTAEDFRRAFRAATSPGVVLGIGNNYAVSAGPGLGVTVDTGYVIILGGWLYRDETAAIALLAADATNPRIDRIVARLTVSTKTVELAKLTGTPAGSPVAPSLTQTSDVYEIPLAQIAVAAGAVSITSGNITDQRQYAGPTVHDMITGHAASGLTAGHVIRALTATTFGFAALALTDLPAAPSCLATHSVNQSVADSTATVLALNTESFDTDGPNTMHDLVVTNSRIFCKTAGKYLVLAMVQFQANGTGYRRVDILKNGALVGLAEYPPVTTGAVTTVPAWAWLQLAVNDYVEVRAFQTSGGALNAEGGTGWSPLLAVLRTGA
jgi:hypothetical protein